MRLLFLTDDFLPHRGGSRVYYHELLSRMEGVEVRVLTRAQPDADVFDALQPYRIERMPLAPAAALKPLRLQFLPVYWNLFQRARRAARQFRPDVIVAGELVPTGPVAAWLALALGVPLLVFTHAEGPPTLGRTRFQSRLARWACAHARVLVAASDNAKEGLMRWMRVPVDKIDVLLPGVGEEHFADAYRACPFDKRKAKITLLSVGRLISRKGRRVILEAMPTLRRDYPGLELVIAGTGPEEKELKDLARSLALEVCVRFAGGTSDRELLELYAGADCFVLPNSDDPETGDTEGFGIVFGEAAAHGLPVVGGMAGGTAHAIREGETGFRVDGKAPGAVAAALRRILENPDMSRAMGEAGRAMALRDFRWGARAARFRKILEGISQ